MKIQVLDQPEDYAKALEHAFVIRKLSDDEHVRLRCRVCSGRPTFRLGAPSYDADGTQIGYWEEFNFCKPCGVQLLGVLMAAVLG